jgi:hypothetical protein
MAKTGDADAALHNVELLTDADCTPEELLTAAAAFADASTRPTADRALAEHRAARSVLFLRRAVAQGFADGNALRGTQELACLQNRSDFRDVIAKMRRP